MQQLNASEMREFNTCAERSIIRIDNAITRLKQLKEQLQSQHKQMLKDDTSAISLQAHDLVGYGEQLQRVEAELNAASTDCTQTGKAHWKVEIS